MSDTMRYLAGAAIVLTLCGCSTGEVPEHVFIRTESVVVAVTVRSEARVAVGEWLPLSATRSTRGDWEEVRFADLGEGVPWMGYLPPENEPEVAANLRWFAEPMDGVEFDSTVPRPVPLLQRAVRFSKPGAYRLWATSHPPLDATSNALQIEVTAH
jgi:hypothetical protein